MTPCIPACACPGTEQRNWWKPFVSVIDRMADPPGASCRVPPPGHELTYAAAMAARFVARVQTLKSFVRVPLFATRKVTFPAATACRESVIAYSLGFPSVTL